MQIWFGDIPDLHVVALLLYARHAAHDEVDVIIQSLAFEDVLPRNEELRVEQRRDLGQGSLGSKLRAKVLLLVRKLGDARRR